MKTYPCLDISTQTFRTSRRRAEPKNLQEDQNGDQQRNPNPSRIRNDRSQKTG